MSQKKQKEETQESSRKQLQLEEDWRAIDSFCERLTIDEMSLEEWGHVHRSLDLIVEITVKKSEAKEGVVRLVEYTRTISEILVLGQARVMEKQKTRCVVKIAAGTLDCASIVFKGRGDQSGAQTGDLIVKAKVVPG